VIPLAEGTIFGAAEDLAETVKPALLRKVIVVAYVSDEMREMANSVFFWRTQ